LEEEGEEEEEEEENLLNHYKNDRAVQETRTRCEEFRKILALITRTGPVNARRRRRRRRMRRRRRSCNQTSFFGNSYAVPSNCKIHRLCSQVFVTTPPTRRSTREVIRAKETRRRRRRGFICD